MGAALTQQVRAGEGSALGPNRRLCVTGEQPVRSSPWLGVSVMVGPQVSADETPSLCSPFPPADCKSPAPKLCVAFFVPFEFLIFCFAEFIAAICSFAARRRLVWCFSLGSVITFHISDRLLPHNFRLFSLFPPKGQRHNSENGLRSTEAVLSKPNFTVCCYCRAALPFIKVHLQSLMSLPQRDD